MASLPESIIEIERIIGFDAALALVKRFGGLPVLIPRTRSRGSVYPVLVEAIGEVAADILMASDFAGHRLDVPRCHYELARSRYPRIRADFDAGMTMPELVAKYGMTSRHISTICNSPDDAPETQQRTAKLAANLGQLTLDLA